MPRAPPRDGQRLRSSKAFSSLAAARHAVLAKVGWDVEERGLFGAPPISIVVGEEVHVSILKALALLGLGRARVIRVPVDDQGPIRADAIPAITMPAIVCLQAGNVNTGAFDPLAEISDLAHAAGAWVHIDGAFGLWALASPAKAHLARGAALADSWATDAHKWHSAVNYTTLGYGDIILTPSWRLLGPLEAANGALLFGVSAAIVFTVMQHLMLARFRDLRD
jgi:glutamate/tyrosine decarboxylase-like PLP-dependent enzyme